MLSIEIASLLSISFFVSNDEIHQVSHCFTIDICKTCHTREKKPFFNYTLGLKYYTFYVYKEAILHSSASFSLFAAVQCIYFPPRFFSKQSCSIYPEVHLKTHPFYLGPNFSGRKPRWQFRLQSFAYK